MSIDLSNMLAANKGFFLLSGSNLYKCLMKVIKLSIFKVLQPIYKIKYAYFPVQALEVLEQCSLNAGPNQKLATVRGTISYQIKLVNVPSDFWKEGVGTSKRIINKILKKITSYEDDMDRNLDDEIQGKIVERFRKINDGKDLRNIEINVRISIYFRKSLV